MDRKNIDSVNNVCPAHQQQIIRSNPVKSSLQTIKSVLSFTVQTLFDVHMACVWPTLQVQRSLQVVQDCWTECYQR